jgi:hypothetical protein
LGGRFGADVRCIREPRFGAGVRVHLGVRFSACSVSARPRAAFVRLSVPVSGVCLALLRPYVQRRCLAAPPRYFELSTRGDPVASQMSRPPVMALLLAPALAPLGNFFSSRTLPPPSTV